MKASANHGQCRAPQMPTPPSGAPSPVKANGADANGASQHGSRSAAAAPPGATGRASIITLQAQLAGAQAQAEGTGAKPAEFAERPFSVLSPNLQVWMTVMPC